MHGLLQVLTLLAIPGLALVATRHVKPLAWLGPVVLCYVLGIALGNTVSLEPKVSLSVSEAAVPLAIPLLLFSADVPKWLRLARSTLLSFALACVAAVFSSLVLGWYFRDRLDEHWKIAGMLVGVYTGGTANMSAIGLALNVREESFILLNAADMVLSGIYLLVLMTVAQRLALRVLPAFPQPTVWEAEEETALAGPRGPWLQGMGLSLLLAAGIAGASVGLTLLATGKVEAAWVLLLLTVLGLGASFVPAVRQLPGSQHVGDFVLLVFCAAVGSLADVRQMGAGGLTLFTFCAGVVTLSITLHLALAALFRIDADTFLITSTAAIFSPAHVAPVARALRNRDVLVSGLTTALIGYAAGNWLGLATAWLLRP